MAAVDRLYLDTNVFITMAEGSDDLSQKLYELVAAQMPGDSCLFTSGLSLAELLVYPLRQKQESLAELYRGWITDGGWLNVGPVERSVLEHAAEVRSQYPSTKLPDAIHISTAIGFQCTHLLTGDKRLPSKIELWRQRWGVTRGPARLETVLIDLAAIDSVLQTRKSTE